MNKAQAENRISALSMDDLPLVEITPRAHAVVPDWFVKYKTLRREFMKSLQDSIQELSFLNLSQEEFMGLIMGRELPANLTLRFRVPLIYGGKLEINNMFMCRTFPHGHNMDRFIIEQNGAGTLWLPNPAKKVYVPAHLAPGTEGGNATTDRLTQSVAAMVQGRE